MLIERQMMRFCCCYPQIEIFQLQFQIDLTKMPLGKLSRKQIESAYKILSEVQTMVKEGSGSDTKYLDASNRFFTLIPHDFGMNSPPILDNEDYIKVT